MATNAIQKARDLFNKVKTPSKQVPLNTPLSYSFWHSPVGKALVGAQKFVESPRPVALPTFKTSPTDTFPIKAAKFGANIPLDIANTIVGQGVVNPALDIGRLAGARLTNQDIPTYGSLKSAPVK